MFAMRAMVVVTLLIAQAGCTARSLRRHTIGQAETWVDIPYRQVLENLAMVANNPSVLPSYSVIDAGTVSVNDTFSANGAVNILANAAGNGSFDPSAKRSINGNWVLTQVTGPEKLRALRLAFQYGVTNDASLLSIHDHRVTLDTFCFPPGVFEVCHPGPAPQSEMIPTPTAAAIGPRPENPVVEGTVNCNCSRPGVPGYYFGVASELAAIPRGWLNVGCKKQVPKCARYVANCCDTYVWVNDAGMEGLSRFTLTIQQIARMPTEAAYAPVPTLMAIKNLELVGNPAILQNHDSGVCAQIDQVQLPIDCYGNIVIQKIRGDAIQTTDSKLKSALTGVIKTQ